jgi:hypothetical protein
LDSRKAKQEPILNGHLPRELSAFWAWSVVGFALTFAVGWLKYHAGATRFNWDPLSDPLFGDMMEYPGTYSLLHSASFFNNVAGRPWAYPMYSPVAYPPFAAVVMAPMYAFPIPELLFLTVAAVWLAVGVWWVRRALMRTGIKAVTATLLPLTIVLISFPIARLIHQGNIELVVWIFTATGVWAYMRGRDNAAAVLWGLAAAMKLFPLILLALLLPRGRYRAFVVGIATFVGATVVSLWWLGPTIGVAWKGSLHNVFGYQSVRVAEWSLRELVANHSVFELAKVAALVVHYPLSQVALPYYAGGALLMAFVFFKKLWKMPQVNQLLAVSTFMVMFPPISYYHALVHMYAPLAVLGWLALRAQRASVTIPGLKATMLLFVPLFAPFTVLTFPRALVFCGVVQSVVLLVLFLRATEYPLEIASELADTSA